MSSMRERESEDSIKRGRALLASNLRIVIYTLFIDVQTQSGGLVRGRQRVAQSDALCGVFN